MADHQDSLEYTADQLVQFQTAAPYRYNSYTFASYYLSVADFRKGGTKDDKGNITYSDEEKAAAIEAARLAANLLTEGTYADLDAFDEAIKQLPVNKDKESAAATRNEDVLYEQLTTQFQDWLIGKVTAEDEDAEPTFEVRNEGDLTIVENYSGTGENKVVSGFWVLRFGSVKDNAFAMKNVRHVLIAFEGGKTDSNGNKTYSEAEKLVAKEKAEQLLSDWVAKGDVSEDSFAELAKANSKDGNAAQGGLYEDVYPGQMVAPFEDWLYDAERKVGDYGIVETDFGYHIMFFVGDSDTTFRDFMITNVLRAEDMDKWHNGLVEKLTLEVLTIKHVDMDMVLGH